jgi:hypothetical protein
MPQPVAFYVEQAVSCGKAAAAATLANERDKFLQAQAAWQALADGTAKAQAEAAKRDARRSEPAGDAG